MQHIETERKYTVEEQRLGGDLDIFLDEPYGWGGHESFELVADYVDTPDLALIRADHTLRRRTGGTDEGWHLKGPKVDEARVEQHAPLAAGRSAALVPPELRARVAEVVGLDALVPVARLVTQRTEHQILRIADGAVIAVMADDRVEAIALGGSGAGGSGGRSVSWREVEIELVEGSLGDLDAMEVYLLEAGLSPSAGGPKVAHALGVAVGSRAEESRPDQEATVGEVVLRHLRRQVGAIQGLEDKTRSDAPDAVHKSRVACRRLRSSLRSFRGLLDRSITDPIALEVRWWGEELGGPRDAEVLRERLLDDLAGLTPDEVVGDILERLPASLDRAHELAHAELVTALGGDRFRALMDSLVGLLVEPPLLAAQAARPAGEALAKLSKRVSRRVEVARAEAMAEHDDARRLELLHEVRKKAKAARYAHEAFGHLGDRAARADAERWEEVTENLGELQDTTVATERLRELAAEAAQAGQPVDSYAVLVGRQQARGRKALERAERALDRLAKA